MVNTNSAGEMIAECVQALIWYVILGHRYYEYLNLGFIYIDVSWKQNCEEIHIIELI